MERTKHGEERHKDENRPTSEANNDKETSNEIYFDIESEYYVFVGAKGRTHIFTADGEHHTSFRTTQSNRIERNLSGKWELIERIQLPETLK
jgi:hypothetical protein